MADCRMARLLLADVGNDGGCGNDGGWRGGGIAGATGGVGGWRGGGIAGATGGVGGWHGVCPRLSPRMGMHEGR